MRMRTLSIIISEISDNRHFINEIKTLMKILIFACGVRRVVGQKLLMTFAIRSSAVNVENFCSASSSDFFSFSKSPSLAPKFRDQPTGFVEPSGAYPEN